MANYKTVFHRDGTVTVWDVYTQQWRRMGAESLASEARLMATLREAERRRILQTARQHTGALA